MRRPFTFIFIFTLLLGQAWSAESKAPAATSPMFVLPEVGEKSSASRFSPAQVRFIESWLTQLAPECPPAIMTEVADEFLAELQQRHPAELERLLAPDFPARNFASLLLRLAGTKVTGATQAAVREKLAERRLAALLAAPGAEQVTGLGTPTALLAMIKDASSVQHRRILEGRVEDADLVLLLKKTLLPDAEPAPRAPVAPKELTAADIVSEFARRNQTGAALTRLMAYTVEGKITVANGEEVGLLLFKMRPARFRLVLRKDGLTASILAADGERFWQQLPGRPPQFATAQNMGPRRHLGEFIDPLFVGEGYNFERLPDGTEADRKFHRLAIRRSDGSRYVARIDTETFRETGRENEDGSITRYSDFREVAGVTLAFREESSDSTGQKTVLVLSRITPNPGLVSDLFQPPAAATPDYFQLEKIQASAAAAAKQPAPAP